jgi:hypothetical protein
MSKWIRGVREMDTVRNRCQLEMVQLPGNGIFGNFNLNARLSAKTDVLVCVIALVRPPC